VHDCILDQRAVADALAISRRLVGHFKHSTQAAKRLADIQRDMKVEVLRPVQDVATRWNSTYYMIDRLLKIRRAISLFCSENVGMQDKTLSMNMWKLLENVKFLLEPVEQLAGDPSCYDAFVMTPLCHQYFLEYLLGLKLTLENDSRDYGIKTMKTGLLEAISNRFDPMACNDIATLSTDLDPRFKLRFLFLKQFKLTV
jgi:hypothetical protein